jgi:hypothetical protein
LPIVSTAPYPLASDVSLRCRALLNDMSQDVEGDLFADDQPYTFVLMQSSFEELQDRLMDENVATYTEEAFILDVPASTSLDVSSQSELSFTGYFDSGISYAEPSLPPDLLQPELIFERQVGTTGPFIPMREQSDGKPSYGGKAFHRTWDWRKDSIFMPSASYAVDLKIRYLTYAPEITAADSPVSIIRCTEALANLTCARYAQSRGSALAAAFTTAANTAIERMTNRDGKRKQRRTYRRRGYRSGGRGRGGIGIALGV